ncbi:MAG: PDZ domain-containing protein [Nitrospira sp.]|nr:PDZ domain-containing protein [Nitrospira sp.]
MPPSPIARRIIGGACLASTALIIAHATNAFVADALDVPPEPPHLSTSAPGSVDALDPAVSQLMAEDILWSGLFELPPTFQLTKDGALVAHPAPPPPPIEAARKVALLGSVSGRDGGLFAVFEDVTSKEQQLYRLDTEVPNVGTLAAIERDRVLFRNGPSEEWLGLAVMQHLQEEAQVSAAPRPVQAQKASARRVLDRREVTDALNNPTRLMTQAQAVPYLTDGTLDGFRLDNVVPEGFFDKIGLRANDIVQRINGVELRDPGMLLSLFQQLRNERTVRVDLTRNSQRQTLTYDIR